MDLRALRKRAMLGLSTKRPSKGGYAPLLEAPTESDRDIGRRLSAFNLRVVSKGGARILLECVYPGSKVFEGGGPYTDLYEVSPKNAKRDIRQQESGALVGFCFEGTEFEFEPATYSYDWLYCMAIFPLRTEIAERLSRLEGFTDIEFNAAKSIRCQAWS